MSENNGFGNASTNLMKPSSTVYKFVKPQEIYLPTLSEISLQFKNLGLNNDFISKSQYFCLSSVLHASLNAYQLLR